MRRGVGPLPHDEGQVDVALVAHLVDHGAVGGDHLDLAVALPEGGGLALDLVDHDLVGIELAHRHAGDERLGEQALARPVEVEEGHRGAPVDPGGGEHLALVHPRDAGDRHPLDAEAGDAGHDVEGPPVLATKAS